MSILGEFELVGFYNYSVILTYIGLLCSFVGISFAMDGHFLAAIICLLISGCCDLFDGRVARTMKNRSADEENFGIQIDSLCDLVCFTVLPATISYCIGGGKIFSIASGALLILAGVIRLAYFNVVAMNRMMGKGDGKCDYVGLPVTTTALIVPFLYLFKGLFGERFPLFFHLCLVIISILFISPFKIGKPGTREVILMVVAGAAIAATAVFLNM